MVIITMRGLVKKNEITLIFQRYVIRYVIIDAKDNRGSVKAKADLCWGKMLP